jgi:hypothetical protein
VIKAFAANRTDQAFYVGTLPGCMRCGQHLLDSHRLQLLHKLLTKNTVATAKVAIIEDERIVDGPSVGFSTRSELTLHLCALSLPTTHIALK